MHVSMVGAHCLTYGRLLALPANTRLGWKGMPETNTLAYLMHLLVSKKMYSGACTIKTLTAVSAPVSQ